MLLTTLNEIRGTYIYRHLVRRSRKRTEEATQLKRQRNYARFQLRRGKRHANAARDTELAENFKSDVLAQECAAAEAEYTTLKLQGVAQSIGDRMH